MHGFGGIYKSNHSIIEYGHTQTPVETINIVRSTLFPSPTTYGYQYLRHNEEHIIVRKQLSIRKR